MLFFAPILTAQQARFDEATFLLEQNEFRNALDMYHSIADNGYSSGALWLNMGIAYTALDSLGVAKYYLLQAKDHSETESLAEDALSYVNERFNRRSAVLPQLPWNRFFNFLSEQAGPFLLFILALIALYGGTAFVIAAWFSEPYRSAFRYAGLSLLIFSGLIFGTAFYVQYLDSKHGTGVLVDRQATVYQQPDPESVAVSTAYEGYTLQVDFIKSERYDDWSYVRLENGMFGWVNNRSIRVY